MLKDPEFISKLRNLGLEPFYHDSSDAREYVRKEIIEVEKLWGEK